MKTVGERRRIVCGTVDSAYKDTEYEHPSLVKRFLNEQKQPFCFSYQNAPVIRTVCSECSYILVYADSTVPVVERGADAHNENLLISYSLVGSREGT